MAETKKTEDYVDQAEGELATPFPPYDPNASTKDLAAREDAIKLATLDAIQAIAAAILALVGKR